MRALIRILAAAAPVLCAAGCTITHTLTSPPVQSILWQPEGTKLELQTNDTSLSDRWFYYSAATELPMTGMEVTWSQLSGTIKSAHGILFCLQDAGNYYFFLVTSERFYKIGKVVGGTESVVRAWTYSSLLAGMGETNTVRITNTAGTFTISIDGTVLTSFQDTALAGGTEEFAAYIMPAAYEDFPFVPESFSFSMTLPRTVP